MLGVPNKIKIKNNIYTNAYMLSVYIKSIHFKMLVAPNKNIPNILIFNIFK